MSWLAALTLETVIVHMTDDGPSVKGVKAAVYDDCLVLRDAFVLEPEGGTMLNGELVIPREKVLFMQVVGS